MGYGMGFGIWDGIWDLGYGMGFGIWDMGWALGFSQIPQYGWQVYYHLRELSGGLHSIGLSSPVSPQNFRPT